MADKLPWAAWYNTWLLSELMPTGVVFSFLDGLCTMTDRLNS